MDSDSNKNAGHLNNIRLQIVRFGDEARRQPVTTPCLILVRGIHMHRDTNKGGENILFGHETPVKRLCSYQRRFIEMLIGWG